MPSHAPIRTTAYNPGECHLFWEAGYLMTEPEVCSNIRDGRRVYITDYRYTFIIVPARTQPLICLMNMQKA